MFKLIRQRFNLLTFKRKNQETPRGKEEEIPDDIQDPFDEVKFAIEICKNAKGELKCYISPNGSRPVTILSLDERIQISKIVKALLGLSILSWLHSQPFKS